MTGSYRIVRNVFFLLGANAVSWAVSLLFWLVVPRIIGPNAWGESMLGIALSGIAFAVGGLGTTTYLVREVARDRSRMNDFIAVATTLYLVLTALMVAGVGAFIHLAGYSPHTGTVILLSTASGVTVFLVAPVFSALQALERMRLAAILQGARQVVTNCSAVTVAILFKPDIVALMWVMLAAHVAVTLAQLMVTRGTVPLRLKLDLALSLRLIKGGLPFWGNNVFLTIYVWIDSVLLSVLASAREVGYYAAPVQIVATLGFLPTILTFAIFPALSHSFRNDFDRLRQLTRASLSLLIALGSPISIGIALVGPNVIRHLFGSAYRPSGATMIVLALTIVPGYLSVLAYYVLAAVDRERIWAYVLAAMCVVNPVINLITIPLFQARFGHGSIGAAAALVVTDWTLVVIGLVLIPRECLTPFRPLLSIGARSIFATALMAVPVWFLRDTFLPIPIFVGISVFAGAAFVLGVFRSEGYVEAWNAIRAKLRRRHASSPGGLLTLAPSSPVPAHDPGVAAEQSV